MTELNTAPQLAPHERCTGCAACCNGCPKGAIRMIPDREGFLYPQVTDGCVQCGHCTHICPVLKQREPRTEPAAFAVWNGDADVRRRSTAGVPSPPWRSMCWRAAAWCSARRWTMG